MGKCRAQIVAVFSQHLCSLRKHCAHCSSTPSGCIRTSLGAPELHEPSTTRDSRCRRTVPVVPTTKPFQVLHLYTTSQEATKRTRDPRETATTQGDHQDQENTKGRSGDHQDTMQGTPEDHHKTTHAGRPRRQRPGGHHRRPPRDHKESKDCRAHAARGVQSIVVFFDASRKNSTVLPLCCLRNKSQPCTGPMQFKSYSG